MEKLKTDGIEFTNDAHDSRQRQGQVWGAGIGAGLGGGLLGFLLGKSTNNPHRCNGPIYTTPIINPIPNPYMQPSGCSENQFVNRFELQQSERAEKLESELAKEKAERYADSIGIATFEKVVNYFDKNMERRDSVLSDLSKAVATLDKDTAVNGEKLNCLRDKVAEAYEAIASLGKSTTKAISMVKSEVESWANASFIHQPRLKPCCGTPTWECAGCATSGGTSSGTTGE